MLQNYFKVALRHLSRNKVYVIINTAGMGIAMACCITSYLLIAFNIEFDNYFQEKDVVNTVKLVHHYRTTEGKEEKELVCPLALGPIAKEEIAGIDDYTRFFNEGVILSHGNKAFHENVRFADASFFKIFDLQLTQGSQKSFDGLQAIILNPTLAKKYFGDEDPTGKMISMEFNGRKFEVIVGGVFDKIPLNTSFNIDALLRIEIYLAAMDIKDSELDGKNESTVLLKLVDIKQKDVISKQMDKYIRLRNKTAKEYKSISYELVPFLHPIINGEVTQSDLRLPIPTIALVIFGMLGLLILLIACFNLTNTTMALAGRRQKEIGIRKVIGSGRIQIAKQFLLEMVLTISLAIVAGVLIAQIIVPQFALMWKLQYGLEDLSGGNFVVALMILLFLTAILAGIYPALSGSKLNPIVLMKGNKRSVRIGLLSKSLLIGQFALSVIVLLAGIVFIQNADYQKNLPLGYAEDELLTIVVQNDEQFNRLKNSITTYNKIKAIAGAENHIGPYSAQHRTIRIDTTNFISDVYNIGASYIAAVGLNVTSGRGFIDGSEVDEESSVLIDENFATNHSMQNPLDTQIFFENKPYRIVGVVNNHLSGLKKTKESEHIYFLKSSVKFTSMIVRANKEDLKAIQTSIEDLWKKLFPGTPYQSALQEQIVFEEANAYNTNLKQIFLFLTILGCLLSVSGIYALTSLHVQSRTKEIGVRKVLGASVTGIVRLLNREFSVVFILSSIIGGGGGYFLTNALMDSLYRQHIQFGFGIVSLCGAIIFLVGTATTSITVLKVAMANPTESLRSE